VWELGKAGAERAGAEDAVPPPLKALGGWPSAEWFVPSVVSDDEVVGLTLPDLPGRKKQSFRIVERSAAEMPRGKKATVKQEGPAARGIGHVLDWIGATQVAVFRRTTLLFDSRPVLYFATIPQANLKVRTANRLRRELMETHFRGCIVHTEPSQAIAMFWPEAEAEITGFVSAAGPPHALHTEFDEAEAAHRAAEQDRRFSLTGRRAAPPPPANPAKRLDERERRKMQSEKQALLQEIQALRTQIGRMHNAQSELSAMEALGLDDDRLKAMLRLLHPDKHDNSEAANDAAKWLNNLRDLLKTKKG
jgi:hypothetical protein